MSRVMSRNARINSTVLDEVKWSVGGRLIKLVSLEVGSQC